MEVHLAMKLFQRFANLLPHVWARYTACDISTSTCYCTWSVFSPRVFVMLTASRVRNFGSANLACLQRFRRSVNECTGKQTGHGLAIAPKLVYVLYLFFFLHTPPPHHLLLQVLATLVPTRYNRPRTRGSAGQSPCAVVSIVHRRKSLVVWM